jgi:hypothetical protein
MHFQLKRLTEEVYELEFIDNSVSTSIMLSINEIALIGRLLEISSDLVVSEAASRWYNV